MRKIDSLLSKYGESHQNGTNKFIHWICVPAIMFSLVGLIYSIPWPFGDKTLTFNWATVFMVLVLLYYIRLSIPLALGFILIGLALIYGNHSLSLAISGTAFTMVTTSLLIFVVAWVGQFVGHKIEGAKPSFLEDVQFLLIGPAWLMHFIFKKVGLAY